MSSIGKRYPRLNLDSVGLASEGTLVPNYQKANLAPGVLHIGVGAFHRAHQCAYFDALARAGNTNCGVVGVSLKSGSNVELLKRQDCLYTLSLLSEKKQVRIIGCILGIENRDTGFGDALALFGSESLKLVTLTVTEKGYGNESTELVSFLSEGLQLRRSLDQPLVIASCDNLQSNGDRLAELLETHLAGDADLLGWVRQNIAFPNSMVDAITPASTPVQVDLLEQGLALRDEVPVFRESFSEWIIERCDCGLDLASAGIRMVDRIGPHELLKLRILNASHSLLAYLGIELGYDTVYRAMDDSILRQVVEHFMEEVCLLLDLPADINPVFYCEQVRERFSNPAIEHKLAQISEDGSVKLKERVLPVLLEHPLSVQNNSLLCFPLVLWMNHVSRIANEGGELKDHEGELLCRKTKNASPEQIVSACIEAMGVTRSMPNKLTELLVDMLVELKADGARIMMTRMVDV